MASTDATRGGAGRGRGGPRGRGKPARGGGNAPPLAAQMKQLQRLDEPSEMALFRRYRALGPTQVISTYGPLGLLDQKVVVPSTNFRTSWGVRCAAAPAVTTNLTLIQCETSLAGIARAEEETRLLTRRVTRLAAQFHTVPLGDLPVAELDKLSLSNAEFARRFPAAAGNGGAAV